MVLKPLKTAYKQLKKITTMKKNLLILIVALFAVTYSADAQKRKYDYYKPGYWGNI